MVSEAFRSISANASTTIAATMTVLIAMFLLGLAVALGTWALSWSDQQKDKLLLKVYFCTPLTCSAGEATGRQIEAAGVRLSRMPGVRDVDYVSKQQALEIMKKRTPELVDNLAANPLPPAYEVVPERAEDIEAIARRIERAQLPGIEKVNSAERITSRVLRVAGLISVMFAVAVVVLVVASTLLIANTIRLSIFSRRREIEVMKLVGATNWFVRGPFMVEGLLCGLVGSAVAVVLLLVGKELALPAILGHYDESGVGAISFIWNAAILVAAGLVLGAAGSGLTLRRFLRI